MDLLVLQEAIFETVGRGGWVMWPIFFTGWLAWYFLLERSWVIWKTYRTIHDVNVAAQKSIPFGTQAVRHTVEAWIHDRSDELYRHLRTIGTLAALAPLMGLLGTVIGMVQTFEIITRYGFGNPVLLAEGISVALLTTQAGLVVAFPIVIFHNFLHHRIVRFVSQAHALGLQHIVPSLDGDALK